ncbi:hypothetical protein BD779DRAFT_1671694 [Infundibulicybe gibba]|nr:hypothetical protein BD779DRAFT_1671694 [Infundibulicybe gibba]
MNRTNHLSTTSSQQPHGSLMHVIPPPESSPTIAQTSEELYSPDLTNISLTGATITWNIPRTPPRYSDPESTSNASQAPSPVTESSLSELTNIPSLGITPALTPLPT